MSDLENLTKLNEGYIRSVQESDIKWFGEMLTEDFLNTNPDGSLVDKAGFLKQIERHGIAKPQNATPQEFLRLVQQQWAAAGAPVETITELYCRGRFGKVILTQQEIDLAYHSLKQLALLEPPAHP